MKCILFELNTDFDFSFKIADTSVFQPKVENTNPFALVEPVLYGLFFCWHGFPELSGSRSVEFWNCLWLSAQVWEIFTTSYFVLWIQGVPHNFDNNSHEYVPCLPSFSRKNISQLIFHFAVLWHWFQHVMKFVSNCANDMVMRDIISSKVCRDSCRSEIKCFKLSFFWKWNRNTTSSSQRPLHCTAS